MEEACIFCKLDTPYTLYVTTDESKTQIGYKNGKVPKNGQKSDYIVFLNSGGGGMSGEYELNKIFAAFG